MTRFVPIITASGTVVAIDAHRVKSISELPDGMLRIWDADETSIDVPGTITGVSALLSDPPAGAVRFVAFGDRFINPDRVAWVQGLDDGPTRVWFSGKDRDDDYVAVLLPAADVIAKLEGRAL